MATPMDERSRPSLALWTPHYSHGGFPYSSSPKSASSRSHVYSPSQRSPKALPMPLQPSSTYDEAIRKRERALVESLDQVARQSTRREDNVSPAGSASASRPLSPINEGQPLDGRRFSSASLSVPGTSGSRRNVPPLPTPVSPATAFPRRGTIVAEVRSMLLHGMPEHAERRQSAPVNRPPGEVRKTKGAIHLEQLRAWGHVHLGNAKTADVFVQPVAYRRPSGSGSSEHSNHADNHSPHEKTTTKTTTTTKASLKKPGQTTLRARIRPRDIDRKPFLIQRDFDIDQLRATIPDPLPAFMGDHASSRRSSLAVATSPGSSSTNRQPLPANQPRRRSSSARHGLVLPSGGEGLRSASASASAAGRDSRAASRSSGAVPVAIHLEYARAHMPVLAALIVSGHVREGDVIDLPVPHPEAWSRTVAYVYTGQGELTEAVKENILHLAGKAH